MIRSHQLDASPPFRLQTSDNDWLSLRKLCLSWRLSESRGSVTMTRSCCWLSPRLKMYRWGYQEPGFRNVTWFQKHSGNKKKTKNLSTFWLYLTQGEKECLNSETTELKQKVRYLQDQLLPLSKQREYQEKEIQRLNRVGVENLLPQLYSSTIPLFV